MKSTLTFLFAAIVALSGAQAKYDVMLGKKKLGTAAVHQKLREDGGKVVQMTIELRDEKDQDTKIRVESQFDKTGSPVRKFMETSVSGRVKKTVVATFDEAGANVVISDGGVRSTKSVTLVANANRANAAEFWFVRDKPKPKAKVVAYTFDLDTLSWQLTTSVYKGESTVGGIKGHEVGTERYVTLLDNLGLPLIVDMGATRLVRK